MASLVGKVNFAL